jgi:hypothetical protein
VQHQKHTERSGWRRDTPFPSPAALAAAVSLLESLEPGAREVLVEYYLKRGDQETIRSNYRLTEEEFRSLRKTARDAFAKLRWPSF